MGDAANGVEQQLAGLQAELETSRAECRQLKQNLPENQTPDRHAALQQKIERQQQIIHSLRCHKKENQGLQQDLAELQALNAELNSRLAGLDAGRRQPACSPDCPSYATCARRILLVGGITKMAAHYREIVTDHGATFDHHDGYMRDGEQTLEGQINRCDLVLCPVDVNSHSACLSVKKICKRLNKPYRMLPSSSISTVARSLKEPLMPL